MKTIITPIPDGDGFHFRGVKRVSDEEAARLVKSGEATYVPKKLWKEAVRDTHKPKEPQ